MGKVTALTSWTQVVNSTSRRGADSLPSTFKSLMVQHKGLWQWGDPSKAVVLNPRQFFLTRGLWQCLEIFLVVTTWGSGATDIQWVETRDAAKHPIMHRRDPQNEELPGPGCQQPAVENPWVRGLCVRPKAAFLITWKMNASNIRRFGWEGRRCHANPVLQLFLEKQTRISYKSLWGIEQRSHQETNGRIKMKRAYSDSSPTPVLSNRNINKPLM